MSEQRRTLTYQVAWRQLLAGEVVHLPAPLDRLTDDHLLEWLTTCEALSRDARSPRVAPRPPPEMLRHINTLLADARAELDRRLGGRAGLVSCPCCGFVTLLRRGWFEICPVCFWEDDGQDEDDADAVRGGPNRDLSLTQARANFREFGAYSMEALRHVRRPAPEEHPAG